MSEEFKIKLERDLLTACKIGDVDMVAACIREPESQYFTWYAYEKACSYGHLDVVKLLKVGSEAPGLLLACRAGHLDIVKYLATEKNIVQVVELDKNGTTALQEAIKNQPEILDYFIRTFDIELKPEYPQYMKDRITAKKEKSLITDITIVTANKSGVMKI